jgi:hypothetical protein
MPVIPIHKIFFMKAKNFFSNGAFVDISHNSTILCNCTIVNHNKGAILKNRRGYSIKLLSTPDAIIDTKTNIPKLINHWVAFLSQPPPIARLVTTPSLLANLRHK